MTPDQAKLVCKLQCALNASYRAWCVEHGLPVDRYVDGVTMIAAESLAEIAFAAKDPKLGPGDVLSDHISRRLRGRAGA